MAKQSAGLLPYRRVGSQIEVLLVHPGGPFWQKKDAGAWSIVKGELNEDEDTLAAAQREFLEETGITPVGEMLPLSPVRQKNGKIVYAWAIAMDVDTTQVRSNRISIEWPPRSGRMIDIPEIDRAEWFDIATAREKIIPAQIALLEELRLILESD
ncbi:MAG: NUDIX domain-containing protein [Bacteroidetes bacterium]|nr:NUDIX domain-containing protein [Bacteroidota bacterium]